MKPRLTFLRTQIKDQAKGSVFFSEIRKCRRKGIETKRDEYTWGAPEFKLYPSGFRGVDMCPAAYVLSLTEFNGIEDMDAIYRVKRGSAVHTELQKDIMESDKLYPLPSMHNMPERIKEKLKDKWPEVPGQDLEWSGLSWSADLVMDHKGPTPIEIKSTSIDTKRWPEYKVKNLPSEQHKLQLGIYMVMFNKMGYYPADCEKGILAYVNLLYPPGDTNAEAEYTVHLRKPEFHSFPDDTLEEVVLELLEHNAICRRQYIEKGPEGVSCSYPKCKTHGHRKKTRKNSRPKTAVDTP